MIVLCVLLIVSTIVLAAPKEKADKGEVKKTGLDEDMAFQDEQQCGGSSTAAPASANSQGNGGNKGGKRR